ncbi:PRK06851 family protein [Clostridium sp. BNL1100]|uniref:PRK06851 family protein n=1 Tax=Clostridium sp. BNL1100 TaxID=755731 RepID=UPI00024A7D68|nr:PRK06851 family protein [Clostridium sp. BNL1100]AEY64509.1 hypothetical protein Clo1100_0220 [Clostridium sp. BNL1100]
MCAKIINYYACANSSKGFVNYLDDNINYLDRLFILKGGPATGKSTLMKRLGKEWYNRGFDVEYIHSPCDNSSVDGIILPSLGIGVVDGTFPHVVEPRAPGAIEEYINLGTAWDSKKLIPLKDEILKINKQIAMCYESAYKLFSQALNVHDEWEKIYISNIDFNKMNEITQETINTIIGNNFQDKQASVKNRFFGGATPKGSVDFVMDLTSDMSNRYFIKGRPGSGKSTMLKKIAQSAQDRGFDVEIYHCGFDPDSLDMVIIRELSAAVFDSTAPHEYFPSKDTDRIIDVYSYAIKPGTDEEFKTQLEDIASGYKGIIREGTHYLSKAKDLNDDLENIYIDAIDYDIVDKINHDLRLKIDDYFFSMA